MPRTGSPRWACRSRYGMSRGWTTIRSRIRCSSVSKSDYAKAHGIDPEAVVSHATTGSGPSSSFLGSDMRAAYYGTGTLTGAGQNLGLLEYVGTDLDDLTTYFKNVGQTNNVRSEERRAGKEWRRR